jgi:dTDP-4-amino-4,6-dideoxygalactose transaminase
MGTETLAINGGPKVAPEKFPPWPWYTEEIAACVGEPLRAGKTNYWTGPYGMQFEQKWAEWCGAKFGISTSSGTTALHVAIAGLGIGPGDEVIVPSYSFIASAFSVCQAGAVPVFADVEKHSHTLDPNDIESKISPKTKAIMTVHLYGIMSNMGPILEIAKKHGLKVIEDCAQAHGAEFNGKRAGNIGDIGAFSFCQSKHFSTGGEGGCVITNDEETAWHCRSFRDHGYDVEKRMSLLELEAHLPYIHKMVGFNFRMTEMQSLIGLKEMERLENWNLANRYRNAGRLTEQLKDVKQILHLPLDTPERKNSYWLYPLILDIDAMNCTVKEFTKALEGEGIPCGPVLWPQCYKEEAFQKHKGFGALGYPFKDPAARPEAVQYDKVHCANAAWIEERCFFVPCHPTYEVQHMDLIAEGIKKVIAAYAK